MLHYGRDRFDSPGKPHLRDNKQSEKQQLDNKAGDDYTFAKDCHALLDTQSTTSCLQQETQCVAGDKNGCIVSRGHNGQRGTV